MIKTRQDLVDDMIYGQMDWNIMYPAEDGRWQERYILERDIIDILEQPFGWDNTDGILAVLKFKEKVINLMRESVIRGKEK